MSIPFEFGLGEILKDVVTGFQGVAMGRTQYFTDCNHYGLLPQKLNNKAKPDEWIWLDEKRLSRVGRKKIVFRTGTKPTSGPHPNAPEM